DQSVVRNSDYPAPWVSFGITESIELFKEDVSHTGFFMQLPKRRLCERFAFPKEAAGDRVLPFKRRHASLHQQHLQRTLPHSEDHDVHGHTQTFHDSPHNKLSTFGCGLHDDGRARVELEEVCLNAVAEDDSA